MQRTNPNGRQVGTSKGLEELTLPARAIEQDLNKGYSLMEQSQARERFQRARFYTCDRLELDPPSTEAKSFLLQPEAFRSLGLLKGPNGARFADFANVFSILIGRMQRLEIACKAGEPPAEREEALERLNNSLRTFPFLDHHIYNLVVRQSDRLGLGYLSGKALEAQAKNLTAAILERLDPTSVAQLDELTKAIRLTEVPNPQEDYPGFQSAVVFLGIAAMIGHLETNAASSKDAQRSLYLTLGLNRGERLPEVA